MMWSECAAITNNGDIKDRGAQLCAVSSFQLNPHSDQGRGETDMHTDAHFIIYKLQFYQCLY
jgi:hypothetical protein